MMEERTVGKAEAMERLEEVGAGTSFGHTGIGELGLEFEDDEEGAFTAIEFAFLSLEGVEGMGSGVPRGGDAIAGGTGQCMGIGDLAADGFLPLADTEIGLSLEVEGGSELGAFGAAAEGE